MDVRRILIASSSGKLAIALGWVCGAILLILAFFSGVELGAVTRWLGGYLAFMLARDLVAYRALRTVAASQIAT